MRETSKSAKPAPKFKVGDKVLLEGKAAIVREVRRGYGQWLYRVRIGKERPVNAFEGDLMPAAAPEAS